MFPSKALWDVVSQPFKQSQHGLFQGRMKQYGNNVPFSKHKTRRTWMPNVQHKRLHSEIMGELIRVKLTTRALKTIKKVREMDCFSIAACDTVPRKVDWIIILKCRLQKF